MGSQQVLLSNKRGSSSCSPAGAEPAASGRGGRVTAPAGSPRLAMQLCSPGMKQGFLASAALPQSGWIYLKQCDGLGVSKCLCLIRFVNCKGCNVQTEA